MLVVESESRAKTPMFILASDTQRFACCEGPAGYLPAVQMPWQRDIHCDLDDRLNSAVECPRCCVQQGKASGQHVKDWIANKFV